MSEDWQRVGRAITERIEALSLTAAEIDRAGVSDKTLKRYKNGERIVRADKRRLLCEMLGWEPGSIESLLRGGDPIVRNVINLDLDERLAQIEAQLRELQEEIRARGR